MPAPIDRQIRDKVIHQWISGDSRDGIAGSNGIGAGTVTNIISEWKKGIDNSDYESVRELAVFLKRQGISPGDLASHYRAQNYIKKLGGNEDQIESLITNLLDDANSLSPEQVMHLTNQLFDISKHESISPSEVPAYIKQKIQ